MSPRTNMTVKQDDVIDFVVHDPSCDEALLIMVQDCGFRPKLNTDSGRR